MNLKSINYQLIDQVSFILLKINFLVF